MWNCIGVLYLVDEGSLKYKFGGYMAVWRHCNSFVGAGNGSQISPNSKRLLIYLVLIFWVDPERLLKWNHRKRDWLLPPCNRTTISNQCFALQACTQAMCMKTNQERNCCNCTLFPSALVCLKRERILNQIRVWNDFDGPGLFTLRFQDYPNSQLFSIQPTHLICWVFGRTALKICVWN